MKLHHLNLLNKSGLESNAHQYMFINGKIQIQHGVGDIHIDMTKVNIKENNTIVVRHILGKIQLVVPLNYNINLHMALYGNAYLNGQSYKVENNHIQVEEKPKEENYNVNVYVSTFIGDVEVIYR